MARWRLGFNIYAVIMWLSLLSGTAYVLSQLGSQANLKQTKSLEHYVRNPAELEQDYHYCHNHPNIAACHGIIRMYLEYNYKGYKNPQSGTKHGAIRQHQLGAFLEIDAPSAFNLDIDDPLE